MKPPEIIQIISSNNKPFYAVRFEGGKFYFTSQEVNCAFCGKASNYKLYRKTQTSGITHCLREPCMDQGLQLPQFSNEEPLRIITITEP